MKLKPLTYIQVRAISLAEGASLNNTFKILEFGSNAKHYGCICGPSWVHKRHAYASTA